MKLIEKEEVASREGSGEFLTRNQLIINRKGEASREVKLTEEKEEASREDSGGFLMRI